MEQDIVSPFQVERVNLRIFRHLISRNPRYIALILSMYAHSLTNIRRSHHLRSAYCFARYIDDLLDGDLACPTEQSPHRFICEMLTRIDHHDMENADNITKLGHYVFWHLEKLEQDTIAPSCELRKLIQYMLIDRMRMDHRLMLSTEALVRHHIGIFCSALHVTLCISGAEYRPVQVQSLARAQACLYSIRDLEEDLNKSINNIPRSVLAQAGYNDDTIWNTSLLLESPTIQHWIREELHQGQKQLSECKSMLSDHGDAQFRKTLRPLVRGLTYLAGSLSKKYATDAESMTNREAYVN